MRRFRILALLLLLPCVVLAANSVSTSTTSTASSSNTQEFQLRNGLKLIVREDHRAPVVLTSVWYKVGGSYEHSGITGVSHVLEHMMFRGTKKYGPGVYDKIISANGGQENAMTTADFTMYFTKMSADKLPIVFELEADRMRNLAPTEKTFSKELQVVMEERRMRVDDNPQGLTWERMKAAALVNNPYHHPVVGWMTDIKHLTLKNIKKWYRHWYAPNNAVVVVVGDVQSKQVLALAKKYFGPLKSERIRNLKPRNEIPSLGVRSLVVNAPAKLPWLAMAYNTPSLSKQDQSWKPYALEVLAYILDGGNSSRFSSNLIRGQQVAVSAGASYDLMARYSNVFVLSGTPAPKHTIAQLQRAFTQQIKKLQDTVVTSEELSRVKAQVIAQNVYQKDSLMAQAMQLGMPEMVGLSWKQSDEYVAKIEAVTPEQIQAVSKEYFVPARLTIATLKPVKTNVKPKGEKK